MHVATSSIEKLLDYAMNTPPDGLRSATSVDTLNDIIKSNNNILTQEKKG